MAKIPGVTTMGEVEMSKENGLKTVDEKEKATGTCTYLDISSSWGEGSTWATFRPTKFKTHYVAPQFFIFR